MKYEIKNALERLKASEKTKNLQETLRKLKSSLQSIRNQSKSDPQ